MCWGCVVSPFVGSALGSSFDSVALRSERSRLFKAVSIGLSTSLTVVTALAIRSIFDLSFCGAQGFVFVRAAAIVSASALIGILYAFGVNYILNRHFPIPTRKGHDKIQACDCNNQTTN